MTYLPSNAQLRDAHADPVIAEASEVVRELMRTGLTLTEICRLCGLPGRTGTIRALSEGTAKSIRPEVAQALITGYDTFLTLKDDSTYRVRRSTRPEEPVRGPSDAKPQERLLREDSALVRRLREKNREIAA